mgnify:CR=1 FL=1
MARNAVEEQREATEEEKGVQARAEPYLASHISVAARTRAWKS